MSSSLYFTPEQTVLLDKTRIPKHVAFIPDGNRRWAKKRQSNAEGGHRAGSNVLIEIVKAAKELGVKILTFYIFSTENWTRPKEEVAAFMWLLESFLHHHLKTMQENGIRLQTIGTLSALPPKTLKAVETALQATSHCDQVDLVLALNYGSRNEIMRAVNRLISDYSEQRIQAQEVDEALISKYLDTAKWADPDLLIRTSGEVRVSNFLLWQISYAEIYVTEVLWPDFKPSDLFEAILNFQNRERRLGGS